MVPGWNLANSLYHIAVAFAYFENLFALRDTMLVQNELVRIKSLSSLLDQVGHQEYLYEIFVDATEQVFAEVIQAIQDGVRDDSFLVDSFNVEYSSNAILTHFRVSALRDCFVLVLWLTLVLCAAFNKFVDEIESPAVSSVCSHASGPILRNTSRDGKIGD